MKLYIVSIISLMFMALCLFLSDMIIINASQSMQKGVYYYAGKSRNKPESRNNEQKNNKFHSNSIERNRYSYNDIVIYIPEKSIYYFAQNRDYLSNYMAYILKLVKGLPGDTIEIVNNILFINQKPNVTILKYDSKKRKMPVISNKIILKHNEYFLLSEKENSFDSRYFGPVLESEIRKVRPLWTW